MSFGLPSFTERRCDECALTLSDSTLKRDERSRINVEKNQDIYFLLL